MLLQLLRTYGTHNRSYQLFLQAFCTYGAFFIAVIFAQYPIGVKRL